MVALMFSGLTAQKPLQVALYIGPCPSLPHVTARDSPASAICKGHRVTEILMFSSIKSLLRMSD